MITTDYVKTMAAYNCWQNQSHYRAAGGLNEVERQQPRGAFFGSIHATLSHILWGDQIWMSRFADIPAPKASGIPDSGNHYEWSELMVERPAFDQVIIDWAENLDPAWLEGDFAWFSGAVGREVSKPKWLLVTHMFNHQTHHRGQVHAMLTAAGCTLDDTDIPFMPG